MNRDPIPKHNDPTPTTQEPVLKCALCNGDGRVIRAGQLIKCPRCNGTGKIPMTTQKPKTNE